MEFAPIVPVEYLELIKGREYHLVLPDLCNRFPEYERAYAEASGFKILDNGEAEGTPCPPDELFRIARIIDATEIVVPDTLMNLQATINQCEDFAQFARQHPKYSYMGVIQGSQPLETATCLEYFETQKWLTRVAFPRAWYQFHRVQRTFMAETLSNHIRENFNGVHCLGANDFMHEAILLATVKDSPIQGIDTSLPAVAAIQGISLKNTAMKVSPRRGEGFFETPYDQDTYDLMEQNIETYSRWSY